MRMMRYQWFEIWRTENGRSVRGKANDMVITPHIYIHGAEVVWWIRGSALHYSHHNEFKEEYWWDGLWRCDSRVTIGSSNLLKIDWFDFFFLLQWWGRAKIVDFTYRRSALLPDSLLIWWWNIEICYVSSKGRRMRVTFCFLRISTRLYVDRKLKRSNAIAPNYPKHRHLTPLHENGHHFSNRRGRTRRGTH
jgi:hypothetical protein